MTDLSHCTSNGHILLQERREQFLAVKYDGENRHTKFNRQVRIPEGKQVGCKLVKNIGKLLKFRDDMIDCATQLYIRVYNEKVHHCRLETKKALSVCCVYITARQNNYGITVRDLARFLDTDKGMKKFGAMIKLLKKEYNIFVKDVGLGSEAYNILSKAGFSPDLIKRTERLLLLLQELLIVSGKSRTLVIIAAAFVAWKCQDPIENIGKVKTFCRQFNFIYCKSVVARKKEIYDVLLKLANQIPWIKNDGEKTVEHHLNDILEFQQSLKQQAVAAAVSEFKSDMEKNDTRSLEHVEDYGPFLPPIMKKSKVTRQDDTGASTHSNSSAAKEGNLHSKTGKDDAVFSSDEDEEIFDLGSNDDTEDYIIREEELKEYKEKYLQELESE